MITNMGFSTNKNPKENHTKEIARRCRKHILRMTSKANSGHPGGSLSAIDMLVCLYATRLKIDSKNPNWTERDRFVMSKGHASPGMYAILREMNCHQLQSLLKRNLEEKNTKKEKGFF